MRVLVDGCSKPNSSSTAQTHSCSIYLERIVYCTVVIALSARLGRRAFLYYSRYKMYLTASDLLLIYTAMYKGTAAVVASFVIVPNLSVTWF